ncbi:hypothetical protein N0V95_009320 [Ascochyta clinopodiicola]|nr:hypothetical protein N0V95_009320 [Ascochyta clinopodiicola]
MLSIVNLSAYIDKLSSLFMDIGRSTPRHQALAILYPRSIKLQSHLSEYFIVVVSLCRYLFKFGQKSTFQQLTSSLSDSHLKTFQVELNKWATSIKEDMDLNEAQENSGFRALSKTLFKSVSYQRKLAANIGVLNYCSRYDHQMTWKQTRKAGNTSFFMQCAEYTAWRRCADSETLVFTGKLGSGKSVALANIVDDLCLFAEQERYPIAYFFCKHDVSESLQAQIILGSLVRQLLCTVPDLSKLLTSCEDTHIAADSDKLLDLLFQAFPSHRKAYFVLDGLDECDDKEKEILVDAIRRIRERHKILVCLSHRIEPDQGFHSITKRLLATRLISIPDNSPDIEAFLEAELGRCLRDNLLVIGDPTLVLDIQDALSKGSQGMFLWVALQIQSLCSMKTDHAIREALGNLPKDLAETFARILHKSGRSGQPLQKKTLQLVLAAYRPLTTDELREALSVVPGDGNWDSSRALNDIYSALSCCGCLLTVDEEENTVRVVHHSVKQYILNEPCGVDNAIFSIDQARTVLADIVVTYLAYGIFDTQVSTVRARPIMAQSTPSQILRTTIGPSGATNLAMKLLEFRKKRAFDMSTALARIRGASNTRPYNLYRFLVYAHKYWLEHMPSISHRENAVLSLIPKMIQSTIIETRTASENFWALLEPLFQKQRGEYFLLLQESGKIDLDATCDGKSPLMLVAERGHVKTARLLLSIDGGTYVEASEKGQALLMWAAANGRNDIIRTLLDTDLIIIPQKDKNGITPEALASKNGHTETAGLLRDHEIRREERPQMRRG